MNTAMYVRVSTQRQAQTQTIEQQLSLLHEYSQKQGWEWNEEHIFRDDGYSGASLRRPGLDRLRDQVRNATFDRVLVTAPDRLARNYVHQMLLMEEFERSGCQIDFIDQPMSHNPHDQLLVQIRGAVAEYERSLVAERMRRGRQQKYRAGILLPWTLPPAGSRGASRSSSSGGDVWVVSTRTTEFSCPDQALDASTDSQSPREDAMESSDCAWDPAQSGLHRNRLSWSLPCRQSPLSTISSATRGTRPWRPSRHRTTREGSDRSGSSHRHTRTI